MNEAHEHGIQAHDGASPGGTSKPVLHFTDEEWRGFRSDDKGAGKSVVMLMGVIFAIGLLLYSAVAYICFFNVM